MNNAQTDTSDRKKSCFVVMGFGVKTDLATGRKLDLDKSYKLLIKPVVEKSGFVCVRADEIRQAGPIEAIMYQELLTADMVIADLSTANPNALYELGVRHALRPYTTIVISENKLSYPFDLSHVVITSYTHLGESIDFEEVMRFRKVLSAKIKTISDKQDTDSPVYTFLQKLIPPRLEAVIAEIKAEAIADIADKNITPQLSDSTEQNPTLSTLVQQGEDAIKKGNFVAAKAYFKDGLKMCSKAGSNNLSPNDHYLVQRLALATYKARRPDPVSALNDALDLLESLNLKESNDPETVALAGDIEKRLFELDEGNHHLARSILYYERGYLLRNDWHNGINLSFLLNMRAASTIYSAIVEKIADIVWANRVRHQIIELCQQDLDSLQDQFDRMQKSDLEDTSIEREKLQDDQFWCVATKAEAQFGLGDIKSYKVTYSILKKLKHDKWMMDSFETQIHKLDILLATQRNLLYPSV